VDFEGDNGVVFSNGKREDFDVIIMATGFQTKLPFFDEATKQRLNLHWMDPENPCLYKFLIPVSDVKNIGFVGYINAFRNPTAFELGAHWLTEYFLENLKTPSLSVMKEDVERRINFYRPFMSNKKGTTDLLTSDSPYFDELLEDLNLNPTRTSNFLTEMFGLLGPLWYTTVQEEKIAARDNHTIKKFYFGFVHFLFLIVLLVLWKFYF